MLRYEGWRRLRLEMAEEGEESDWPSQEILVFLWNRTRVGNDAILFTVAARGFKNQRGGALGGKVGR